MRFLQDATRNLFFTGKGGVGKTSLACAARDCPGRARPPRPAGQHRPGLEPRRGPWHSALFLPDAGAWRARAVCPEHRSRSGGARLPRPHGGAVSRRAARGRARQHRGAALRRLHGSRSPPSTNSRRCWPIRRPRRDFDHVVFDTAPTGHTLRLLALPAAWSGFIEHQQTGTSCLGPLAGLETQRGIYEAAVRALGDSARTTLMLVSRPEPAALQEAARTSEELAALGLRNQHLIVNGVFAAADPADPIARALEVRGREALESLAGSLAALPRTLVPLLPREPGRHPRAEAPGGAARPGRPPSSPARGRRAVPAIQPLAGLVDDLERGRPRRRDDDGQGRRRQDDRGRGDRAGAGATRSPGPSDDDRSGRASGVDPERAGPRLCDQPDRPAGRDPAIPGRGAGHRGCGPGCAGSRAARGGSPFAVHGGSGGVPGVCRGGRRRREPVRGGGHGAHRPHHPAAGRRGGLSSGGAAPVRLDARCRPPPVAAPARRATSRVCCSSRWPRPLPCTRRAGCRTI